MTYGVNDINCYCCLLVFWPAIRGHEVQSWRGPQLSFYLQLQWWERSNYNCHGHRHTYSLALQCRSRCLEWTFLLKCIILNHQSQTDQRYNIITMISSGLSWLCGWRNCKCARRKVHKRRVWGTVFFPCYCLWITFRHVPATLWVKAEFKKNSNLGHFLFKTPQDTINVSSVLFLVLAFKLNTVCLHVQVVMQVVRLLPDGHRMKREVDMALDIVSETMTPMHYHLREIIICSYKQVTFCAFNSGLFI